MIADQIHGTGFHQQAGGTSIRILVDLAESPRSSGRRLSLPGGRETVFRFDRMRIGATATTPEAYELPLPVPGSMKPGN